MGLKELKEELNGLIERGKAAKVVSFTLNRQMALFETQENKGDEEAAGNVVRQFRETVKKQEKAMGIKSPDDPQPPETKPAETSDAFGILVGQFNALLERARASSDDVLRKHVN